MERNELLEKNVAIFKRQAELLDKLSKPTVKVVVVGNPANTNALVIAQNTKRVLKKNITALTRLDENRAYGQLVEKLRTDVNTKITVRVLPAHHMQPDAQSAATIVTNPCRQIGPGQVEHLRCLIRAMLVPGDIRR